MHDIEFSSDWGYYIDRKTLFFCQFKNKVPVGAIVITKEWEDTDAGRFVVNKYYFVRSNGIELLQGKRDANSILAEQIFQFMKENKTYPPGAKMTKVFSNGSVELTYTASDYDVFKVKITSAMVGGSVEDFLDDLEPAGKVKFIPIDSWRIDIPKRSAGCRTCNGTVKSGELRIGEPSYFQDHKSFKYHHLSCIAEKIWGIPRDKLEGFDDLSDEDKSKVKKELWD